MAWYSTGTLTLVNGSTTVVGVGTDFISGANVGEALYLNDNLYEIGAIVSATQLTLVAPYLGSTDTGVTYKIIPTQSLVADLAAGVSDLITDYSDVKDTAGEGKFNDGTVTAPGITFEADQNTGIYKINNDNFGLAAGGIKQIDVSSTDVELNHSGSKKLATTSTGVDVTGTVTADGLTVGDGSTGEHTIDLNGGGSSTSTTRIHFQGGGTGNPSTLLAHSASSKDFTISTGNLDAENARVKVANNGDVSFYEDTGTTAKMVWDASAESLAIGSTRGLLHVGTGDIEDNGNTIDFNGARPLSFSIGGTEAMRIASGNVGIGTASPSNKLTIKAGDNDFIRLDHTSRTGSWEIQHSGVSSQNLAFLQDNGTSKVTSYVAGRDLHLWYADGTERARLDSSGNLLVGTTSTTPWTALSGSSLDNGIAFREDGIIAATAYKGTANSGNVSIFSRTGTDGPITSFYKDGEALGRIGVKGGLTVGGTVPNSSLRFTANSITAYDDVTGSDVNADGDISLGNSAVRFKDLYLSGGVYLGGTGADNKLDDYETGTWTPTLGGTWTSNPTALSGTYVKIGKLVYIQMVMSGGAKSSSISAWFDGLPFNISVGSTGSVSDSGVNDKGNCLLANGDNVWLTDTSFSGTTYITATYKTTE